MNIMAVDDEPGALNVLVDAIVQVRPDDRIDSFMQPRKALEFAGETAPDVAFLDIRMTGITGITLAKQLKKINPSVNIIFVTGYSDYAMDAMDLRASGYLLKPVTAEDVERELDNLRNPVGERDADRGLYFQTFGNFEAFFDGKPLEFKYGKTKEMLAYLVDRQGAMCTNNEVIAVLWDDDSHASYYRQLRKDLSDTLKAIGLEGAVMMKRGRIGLSKSALHSDFEDWQKGLPSAINAYHGEYMAQYSWAEATNGLLFNA